MDNVRTARQMPQLQIDVQAIRSGLGRLADARPGPCCGAVTTAALVDLTALLAEVTRLYAALLTARHQSANRLAAIRAALGAAADGEPDPLGFLRDELAESENAPFSPQDGGWWA